MLEKLTIENIYMILEERTKPTERMHQTGIQTERNIKRTK